MWAHVVGLDSVCLVPQAGLLIMLLQCSNLKMTLGLLPQVLALDLQGMRAPELTYCLGIRSHLLAPLPSQITLIRTSTSLVCSYEFKHQACLKLFTWANMYDLTYPKTQKG